MKELEEQDLKKKHQARFDASFIGNMVVPLGWYPSCLPPPKSPSKEDIPKKYPLCKV